MHPSKRHFVSKKTALHTQILLSIYILTNTYHYSSAIEDSEKEFLRQHLIRNFEEPVNPLAVQLAVLIAKIARYNTCDIL